MLLRSVLFLVLCVFVTSCAMLEEAPDKAKDAQNTELVPLKKEEEAKAEAKPEAPPPKVEPADAKVVAAQDEVDTAFPPQIPNGLSTDAVHPYKRDGTGGKAIDVQILKVNGEPTVTDSADPNMASGGGGESAGTVVLLPKSVAAKSAVAETAEAKVPTGVPAEKALGWLKNGNTRFVKGTVRRDGQSAKDRKRVAAKQTPHAVIVACSESVTPPELIFDQKLGEIGVVRNFGAVLDDSAVHAVEESVKQGAHLVVVMNHSGCGATVEHHDAAKELAAKSKLLDALVKTGEVVIKTANYDPDNGRVSF